MVRIYKFLLAALLMQLYSTTLFAEDFYLDGPFNKGLFRFEIDNDTVWNHDSNFSNGWSLQYHTVNYASWEETKAPGFVKWMGQHFPSLADKSSIVRIGQGIGQNMFTPGDLKAEIPLEGDLPYAGTLTYSLSWQSFNRQTARIFQVSAGILGPASLAEQFQKFVHNDLGLADDPKGWDTQRDTEPLLNFGYGYLLRIAHLGGYTDDWGGQLTLASGLSLGNLGTDVEVGLGFRFGWNISEGFSTYPAPPGGGLF